MTREESIDRLRKISEKTPIRTNGDDLVAITMAIQALSQEPCEDWYDVPSDEMTLEQARQAVKDLRKKLTEYLEQEPCDDAISRDEVYQLLMNMASSAYGFEEIRRIVDDLPSITQKSAKDYLDMADRKAKKIKDALTDNPQKSGKWILLDECANSGYYCSRCQKKLVKEGWSDTVKKIKFCPNCGAKMVEPQESEE